MVLFAPLTMRDAILQEAHGAALSGHGGTLKTKQQILQSYFWPGMDQDIQTHLKTCQKCQLHRTRDHTKPALLSPLPQCTQPNQRIHADLFGFLVVSGRGKKGREQSSMPQLRRARTETEAEEWTEMGLEEDVSGDLQTTVEAVTSDKNANYLFVIKTEKTMKRPKLIKPQTMSAKLFSAIKTDPDDPISRRQAREKSIKVLIDYYVSIDTEPKWTRQQWRNFIDMLVEK